jgi:ABC-type cobalamin/Fe3+-siderophores transport system ATPase subunit
MKTLILLRGLPNSGKSTLGKLLAPHSKFEADDYFYDENDIYRFDPSKLKQAHGMCQQNTKECMRLGLHETVVVSNTFTEEWEMAPYLKMAKELNYRVQTIITEKRHDGDNGHNVPEETLQNMRERFEIKL